MCVCVCVYSLQVRREHDNREEERALLDLPAEAENSILLEALADVEDVLILQRDEPHLLQPPATRLLSARHPDIFPPSEFK